MTVLTGPPVFQSKKPTSCFPRPQTTQDRSEQSSSQVSQESERPAPATQVSVRGKKRDQEGPLCPVPP